MCQNQMLHFNKTTEAIPEGTKAIESELATLASSVKHSNFGSIINIYKTEKTEKRKSFRMNERI